MKNPDNTYVYVAVIIGAHGVHGEVKTRLLSDNPDRLSELEEIYLISSDNRKDLGIHTIAGLRGHDNSIVALDGINDRDEALKLKGYYLAIEYSKAAEELEEGEYLIQDLIGLNILDDNEELIGVSSDILDGSQSFVLIVKRAKGKKDVLIPLNPDIVTRVDLDQKLLQVKLPEGLLEVYD